MISLLRRAALLILIQGGLAVQTTRINTRDATATTTPTAATSSKVPLISTCPNRTINHVTHTPAQQCLRSVRKPHDPVQPYTSIGGNATSTSDVTVGTSTQTLEAPFDSATPELSLRQDDDQTEVTATPSVAASANEEYSTASPADAEEDTESPLDNVNFLSFEEWKKQNLAKVGQSPDDIGHGQPVDANRPRPGMHNALDTLGEESEINLDFAGFGGGSQVPVIDSRLSNDAVQSSEGVLAGQQDLAASSLRSKDAGKTCKERSNYASFDCAATILKSNKECKSASSVLVENKDSYMLNTCSATNKFFIVQLCDDIQIDTIVLANYEFFSSSFRHFRVSVSDRYPVKMEKWKELGTFEARNTREIQAFLVPNPLIWARYLRIEFLSHYGTEYYCPVSILRVHGTTMWEDYRHQEEVARGEEEEVTLEVEALATPPVIPVSMVVTDDAAKDESHTTTDAKAAASVSTTLTESVSTMAAASSEPISDALSTPVQSVVKAETLASDVRERGSKAEVASMAEVVDDRAAMRLTKEPPKTTVQESSRGLWSASNTTDDTHGTTKAEGNGTVPAVKQVATTSTTAIVSSSFPIPDAVEAGSAPIGNASHTTAQPRDGNVHTVNMTATVLPSQNGSSTNTTRATVSPTVSQPPQPSTQESFFKSFHKRLQQLESNSTWSLQYIEEQSRILRDAFTKVEKRQLATTTKFLSQLNATVMTELHGFGQSYDQLWQSTVIELEGQREAYQREILAVSTRLTMVADELVWQKRMGIVQSTLLLLCLALAIFTRSENGHLEVPLMQQMIRRSTTALRGEWESSPNSPSSDSRSPVSLFRRKFGRTSLEADRSASYSETSGPHSRDQSGITIGTPSPNSGYIQDDYFDENCHSPTNREPDQHKRESPKKQRKKARKSQGSTHGNGRAKSPLAS